MTLSPGIFHHYPRLLSALAGAVIGILAGGCTHMANPVTPTTAQPTYIAPTPRPTVSPPSPKPMPSSGFALGIDVLAAHNFDVLQGKRVGLLTHAAGVNSQGVSTIEVLRKAPGINLVALYGPEHGIYSDVLAGEKMPKLQTDKKTGLPVYTLYQTSDGGDYRKPSPDMLKDIDVMVVDLQDLGVRSYTFISCLLCTMEACFEQGKAVVILDRPNPLGGLKVGGPPMDNEWMSYVGAYHIPYVYGLTIGELAKMAHDNPDLLPNTDKLSPTLVKLFKTSPAVWQHGQLTVVPMQNWRRSMTWQETHLPWVPTSPRIPSLAAAVGYSLTGIASGGEIGKFSNGGGSAYPFRLLNYPGRKPADLALTLNALNLAGLHFDVRDYTNDNGKPASGVYVSVTDWNAVGPTRLGFEMMKLDATWAANGSNPYARATGEEPHQFNIIVGSSAWWDELRTKGRKANVASYFQLWDAQATAFQQRSRKWWLYPE